MIPGEVMTIELLELVAGGEALARVDGFPVFAADVFPGDVARVRLTDVKKGFAKAELVEIVSPSPWRRAAPCPIAGECGGCDWAALRLDRQLEAKRRILVESLRRVGKIDPSSLPDIAVHPSPLNYRLRSRLHHDGVATGFFALRSNRVVPLSSACEVVGPATAADLGDRAARASLRTTVVAEPLATGAFGLAGRGAGTLPPRELWEMDGELISDDRALTMRVESFTWHLSTRSFFQVNRHLLATMIRLVTRDAARVRGRATAIELYAGAGFFTLPLATLFDRVIAVEGSAESAGWARRNAPANVDVIEAPVERQVHRLPRADLVFLDPPRAGGSRDVISAVGELAREMVAYLSCDPVTFARDASRLIASGWRLSTLDLLDLFPNTHHVETLSSFERAQ